MVLPDYPQDLDGKRLRLFGTPGVPGPYHDLPATKVGAQAAEQRAIHDAIAPKLAPPVTKEVPTFAEWFKGRFWREWVVGRRNKPTEVRSKEIIYDGHLEHAFGHLRLDEIGTGAIAAFRASLVEQELSLKRINNILSKPLKYAVDCELIDRAPKIGMFKVSGQRSSRGTSRSTRVSSWRRSSKARTGTPRRAWQAKPASASVK